MPALTIRSEQGAGGAYSFDFPGIGTITVQPERRGETAERQTRAARSGPEPLTAGVAEASVLAGASPITVYGWLGRGLVPSAKKRVINSRWSWQIDRDAFIRFLGDQTK